MSIDIVEDNIAGTDNIRGWIGDERLHATFIVHKREFFACHAVDEATIVVESSEPIL